MRVWPQGANDLPEIKLTARKGRWTRGEGHRAFDIRLVGDDRTQYPTNDRADCRAKGSERTRDGSTDRGPAKRAATKTASNVRALPASRHDLQRHGVPLCRAQLLRRLAEKILGIFDDQLFERNAFFLQDVPWRLQSSGPRRGPRVTTLRVATGTGHPQLSDFAA